VLSRAIVWPGLDGLRAKGRFEKGRRRLWFLHDVSGVLRLAKFEVSGGAAVNWLCMARAAQPKGCRKDDESFAEHVRHRK
jgi:hypothetical protein